jgi:serine phosphatase RsbU (regulator of sigma subunit)
VIFGTIQPTPAGARLRIATGGHPEPVYRRAGGEVVSLAVSGSLLGILPSVKIGIIDLTLGSGDSIVFYSDGVTEARSNGIMFGTEGLIRAVRHAGPDAESLAAYVATAVVTHSGGVLEDDVALLVFQAAGEAL